MRKYVLPLLLLFGASMPAAGYGALEPADAPVSWDLKFDFYDIQRIALTLPGDPTPTVFWYLLYTVQNDTGRDVDYYPFLELVTDTAKVYPSDIGVSPLVFNAIKRRHKATHPFLADSVRIVGRLLQGEDNAKEGVAIWPQFDIKANQFTVYVSGLSGETKIVENLSYEPSLPQTQVRRLPDGTEIDEPVNPRYFVLRKTLAIRYALPGDTKTRRFTQAQRGIRWRRVQIRGWIGVATRDLSRSEAAELAGQYLGGAKVIGVLDDSPARAAGIRAGDVIVSIQRGANGVGGRAYFEPVRDEFSLHSAIWQRRPGSYVALGVVRAGKLEQIGVAVGEEPADIQEIQRRGLWVMR